MSQVLSQSHMTISENISRHRAHVQYTSFYRYRNLKTDCSDVELHVHGYKAVRTSSCRFGCGHTKAQSMLILQYHLCILAEGKHRRHLRSEPSSTDLR